MKKLYPFIFFLAISLCVIAQAPQKFNYQAIVRDAAGQAITNQSVGIQISLLQTTAVGTAVYIERFTVVTNDYGLVNLDIGNGAVQSGVFADIEWASDKYFIKVELDEAGGTTYVEVGTSQLLSVPYALHSSTAAQLSIGDTWLKNGSELYYNDGNVGIGKIDPATKLDVNGDFSVSGKMNLSGSNQFGTLFFAESTLPHTGAHESILVLQNASDDPNSEANIQFASGSPAHGRATISATHDISAGLYNGNLNLEVRNGTTSYVKALTIRSSGNVGIGNEDPSVKLDVNGDAHVTGDLIVDGVIEGPQYIEIHSSGGPDLSASGIKSYGTVDVNSTGISAALYMAADGNYEEADADNASTMPCVALAIETGTGDKDILLQGYIRNDNWTLTIGAAVYVSPTAGELTKTIPTATGQQVQIVGYATATNIIYFSPDLTLIELK